MTAAAILRKPLTVTHKNIQRISAESWSEVLRVACKVGTSTVVVDGG